MAVSRTEAMYGLKQHTIAAIRAVLAQHGLVTKAMLYGSRAKGDYHNGSDIDLTLMGEGLTLDELFRIETELDDLFLPYKIDLSLYDRIENRDLIDHIERVGAVFYQKTAP